MTQFVALIRCPACGMFLPTLHTAPVGCWNDMPGVVVRHLVRIAEQALLVPFSSAAETPNPKEAK